MTLVLGLGALLAKFILGLFMAVYLPVAGPLYLVELFTGDTYFAGVARKTRQGYNRLFVWGFRQLYLTVGAALGVTRGNKGH